MAKPPEKSLEEIEAALMRLVPRRHREGPRHGAGKPRSTKRMLVEEALRKEVLESDVPVPWPSLRDRLEKQYHADRELVLRVRRHLGIQLGPTRWFPTYAYPPHIPVPPPPPKKKVKTPEGKTVHGRQIAAAAQKGLDALEQALGVPHLARHVRKAEAKVSRAKEPMARKKTTKKKQQDLPSFTAKRQLVHTKDGVMIVDAPVKKPGRDKVSTSEPTKEVTTSEPTPKPEKHPAKVDLPNGCVDFRLAALIGLVSIRRSSKDCLVGQGVRTVEDALRLGRWLVELIGEDQADRVLAYARGK